MEILQKSFSDSNYFTIIFLHGFPYDSRMWKYQFDLGNVNLAALDLLGAGSKKTERLFSLEAMVDTAFSEIYSLGWKNILLSGLSMGGYVALRMLEKYPSFFRGAIFFDTRSEADSNEAKIKRAQNIKLLLENGVEKFVENFVPQTVAPNALEENPSLKRELLEIAKSQSAEGLASQLLAMQGRTDTTHVLSEISIPSLVVCGELDSITSPESMKNFASKIPNSLFEVVPKAGHMAPIEKPEIVNQIINNFINNLPK